MKPKARARRPAIVLVTPALSDANNGNWQTARRWARLLADDYRVQVCSDWPPANLRPGYRQPEDRQPEDRQPGDRQLGDRQPGDRQPGAEQPGDWQRADGQPSGRPLGARSADATAAANDGDEPAAMIALHARRSAGAIAAWRTAHPARPLVVVLTGTDLYRDIDQDAAAQHSLVLADRLVVLNELGLQRLPAPLRAKALVCLQSSPPRRTLTKTGRHLRALMVGHLREEKSPQTYFDAARRLAARPDILLDHIGAALDSALGEEARSLSTAQPNYRWLGALPHAATRARIQAAHVLVHASRMEGGAHVVIEAVTSGTPVLASRIDGNVGLLGAGYGGYFEWGDDAALATLLQRARDDAVILPLLQNQCTRRAPLFAPAHERQTLLSLLAPMLQPPPGDS